MKLSHIIYASAVITEVAKANQFRTQPPFYLAQQNNTYEIKITMGVNESASLKTTPYDIAFQHPNNVERGRIQKHKERLQAQIQALDLHSIFNPPLDHFHASLANEVLWDCQRGLNGVRGVRLSLLEALVVWVNGGVTLCNSLK
ncbi:hypothetical protein Tco_0983298 [Tanacetum coccineum]